MSSRGSTQTASTSHSGSMTTDGGVSGRSAKPSSLCPETMRPTMPSKASTSIDTAPFGKRSTKPATARGRTLNARLVTAAIRNRAPSKPAMCSAARRIRSSPR